MWQAQVKSAVRQDIAQVDRWTPPAKGTACRSGPVPPIPWARTTTGRAPTSRCSARWPRRSSCACSTPQGHETRVRLPEMDGLDLARLPARHRARPALRLPGARALRPGQRAALQPEQAAARSRTRRRSTAPSSGSSRCSATTSATPTAATTPTRPPQMPKSVVINPYFDWGNDRPPQTPVRRVGDLRGARQGPHPTASRHPRRDPRHLRRDRASRRSPSTCRRSASPPSS